MSERSLDSDSEAIVVYDYTLAVASGESPVIPEFRYVYLVLTPAAEEVRRAYVFTPENARALATRLLAEASAVEALATPRVIIHPPEPGLSRSDRRAQRRRR